MKKSLALPMALMGLMAGSHALAQGSGKNVTIFRMAGPQLGVRLEEVDGDVVTRLKLREEKGALVTEVMEKSAAEKAGIRKEDVIVRFQGESILTAAQLSRLVKDVPAGRKVDIDVIRGGAPVKVTATMEKSEWSSENGEFPQWSTEKGAFPDMEGFNKQMGETFGMLGKERMKFRKELDNKPGTFSFKEGPSGRGLMMFPGEMGKGRLGITYSEIEGQLAGYFKSPKDTAVLVNSVVEGSAAEKAGLKAGDLIVKLGGASIADGSDLQEAVSDLEGGKATALTVWRDGRSVELSVTVSEERKARTELLRKRRPVS